MTGAEIIGLIGLVVSAIATAWVGLLRYTISLKDTEASRRLSELERRDAACETALAGLGERLRRDELETSGLHGKVALLEQSIRHLEKEVEDHVPRAEWQREMASVQKQLDGIISRLDRPYPSRHASSSSSGQYSEVKK